MNDMFQYKYDAKLVHNTNKILLEMYEECDNITNENGKYSKFTFKLNKRRFIRKGSFKPLTYTVQ